MAKIRPPFFNWRQGVLESNMGPTTKHVLLTISCHMNDAGESCYPSIEKLCSETSLSNRSVIDHIKIARQLGWLGVRERELAGKRWRANAYFMRWPDEMLEGSEPGSPAATSKVVNVLPEGGEPHDRKAVKEVHLSTSIEYSKSTPKNLDLAAWQRWVDYRTEIRKPLKPVSIPAAQRRLASFGAQQVEAVEHCISNGYQGLFAPAAGKGNGSARRRTFDDYRLADGD